MLRTHPTIIVLSLVLCTFVSAQDSATTSRDNAQLLSAETFAGMELRSLGPAVTPGRVQDIAVDPRNVSVWYVAVASGGVWKTSNRGQTWKPIFDHYGSYSMGYVTLDPRNPDIVWLGTGENQAQRSVGFGDGVYKSDDAGQTWKQMGLSASEHIGKIIVDPRDSNVVFVAAQGPLWAPGGERGLYRTADGGKSWQPILQISENTGITDIAIDQRNPDVMYASAYQRRRNVGVLIGGGPEGGIHKSENGGKTWRRLSGGLPTVDLGRIALAVSPQDANVVYALITAAGRESGFFRSSDRGENWTRQSSYNVVDPQYYGEIYPDPHKFDRVYAVDVNIHVTDDGGKSFTAVPWAVHSDNHAIVFDQTDPQHLLVGNDGGLYETYDGGRAWRHFTNLPTTQFYRIDVDNSLPFYNVYGGAQDNGSLGGPTRTFFRAGIRTSEWQIVGGADGMQPRADPEDPNTVYTMSQNAAILRLDKTTSASIGIRPGGGGGARGGGGGGAAGADRVRWNWDVPFIISPHSHVRLYLAGSKLFRSDDRGDHWNAISPDLTRQLDRDKFEVMGRVWGSDAVTRNLFTTDASVASALSESPLQDGLLYVGTDDGLIQGSEDGGQHWRKLDAFADAPDRSYVSCLVASQHDARTVYAAFNNYQRGDFKPYLYRSNDRGATWTSIAGNLPARHFVWSMVEDSVNRDLLFVGTEFGLFFTCDGGTHWTQLRGGMPTIAIRDLAIQRRENDLVAGSFGRGIFVLDDYSPLRQGTADQLKEEAVLFAPRRTYLYNELTYVRAADGNFATPNPPFGAMLTYYLRPNAAEQMQKDGARIVLSVADVDGKTVRQVEGSLGAGLHRATWDLRAAGAGGGRGGRGFGGRGAQTQPQIDRDAKPDANEREADDEEAEDEDAADHLPQASGGESEQQQPPPAARGGRGGRGGFGGAAFAPLVKPGTYQITLQKVVGDSVTKLGTTKTVEVVPLPKTTPARP